VWYIVKPKGRGAIPFLRSLLSSYSNVKNVYIRPIAYRTNIYAIEVPGEEELGLPSLLEYDVILKADNVVLGEGWTKVEVIEKRFKHKYWDYETSLRFMRIGGKEYPIGRIRLEEFEEIK